jgi:hypothetical protein
LGQGPTGSVVIDIGEMQHKTVSALDILFFPLIKESKDGELALVPYDHHDDVSVEEPSAKRGKFDDGDVAAICSAISRQMEEMYATLGRDEKAWQKFVKRMLFKWHPDKNPSNEEKATEITKFIQNEATRIWMGRPQTNNSTGGPSDFTDPFWEDIFRQWDGQARSQRQSRDRYYSNFRSWGGHSGEEQRESRRWNVPPSFETNNLSASRKWLEQGKYELKVAIDNLTMGHHAYAAYAVRMVSFI